MKTIAINGLLSHTDKVAQTHQIQEIQESSLIHCFILFIYFILFVFLSMVFLLLYGTLANCGLREKKNNKN